MTETQRLLADYVAHGSEGAFHELVVRYLDLVYSTAVRLMDGDAHLAEDVAQTVFVDLSRSAKALPREVSLGGWLHRHTCFTAAKLRRSERRRQSREEQAARMKPEQDHSESNLAELRQVLDEAINRLGSEDRTAVVLRFFERRDFRAIGEALGSNEVAAQKRVSRALEKLHGLMTRRGCSLSLAALGTALTTEAVRSAPSGLAAVISTTALSAGAGGAGLTLTTLKLMAATHLKPALATLLVGASLLTPVVLQQHAGASLRERRQSWRTQEDQLSELRRQNQQMAARLAQVESTPPLAGEVWSELLKLRGDIGRRRDQWRVMTAGDSSSAATSAALLSNLAQEWSARADQLKQWLEENPAAKIPELALLASNEWAEAIYPLRLENEEQYRRAMSNVRANAETRALDLLGYALRKHSRNSDGKPPAALAELAPYLKAPVDEAILGRYVLLPSADLVPDLQGAGAWVITQKAPVDEAWDVRFAYGIEGGTMADCRVTNRWAVGP